MRSILRATCVVLLIGGCSSPTYDPTVLWEATLSPVSPATVRGTAGAIVQGGRTRATIAIRQADEGQAYRWSFRSGSCESPGTLQSGAAVYPVLIPTATGSASANVALSSRLDSDLSYAVWVTVGDTATPVACGELLKL